MQAVSAEQAKKVQNVIKTRWREEQDQWLRIHDFNMNDLEAIATDTCILREELRREEMARVEAIIEEQKKTITEKMAAGHMLSADELEIMTRLGG